MTILFTDEELEIRDTVRRFVKAEIPKYQNEKFYNTIPRELFRSFGELGLTGLPISEAFGGLGRGASTIALTLEEIAKVDSGIAVFISVHFMVSGLIQRYGTDEQKKRYLPKMAAGEFLGAFALTEPSAGSDASRLKSEAKATDDGYILNGEKCYITSAGFADLYVVFAKTGSDASGEKSAFILEADAKGLSIGKPEKKMGGELSPIASLNFDNIKLSKNSLLGTLHKGYSAALSGLAGGRVNIASIANGLSSHAIDCAVAHLKEREQFGKKLAEFQGLQFMLADMKMKLEASRLLTFTAARGLETNKEARPSNLYPSMAKCFSTDSAMSITTDAVQLLGGAGYIKEYTVEGLMRDAKVLQIFEGTNQIQRMVIARELLA